MRHGQRETLKHFTERAIDATFKGELIPPLVYIPATLRGRAARVTVAGHVTVNAADAAENQARVERADPTGFLIAIMQGQPIPSFVVSRENEKETRVEVEYLAPALPERVRAAEVLARLHGGKKIKPGDTDYDTMIARAAADGDDE